MSSSPTIISYNYYIKPTYIAMFPEYDRTHGRSRSKLKSESENLKNNQHRGELSKSARKKLSNAIDWLILSAPKKTVFSRKENKRFQFRANFITLTVPPQKDNIKSKKLTSELLPKLIEAMRYKYQLQNYVWVLELQQNLTPHIHITADTFIHHDWLRQKWNSILKKAELLESHYEKYQNYNPPSTEVKSVINANKIHSYLASYVSNGLKKFVVKKYGENYTQEQYEEAAQIHKELINGRLWGCNYELSDKNKVVYDVAPGSDDLAFQDLKKANVEFREVLSKPDALGRVGWLGNLWFLKMKDWGRKLKGVLYEKLKEHIFYVRYNYNLFKQATYIEVDTFKKKGGEAIESISQVISNKKKENQLSFILN
jgi:hypothetical protein